MILTIIYLKIIETGKVDFLVRIISNYDIFLLFLQGIFIVSVYLVKASEQIFASHSIVPIFFLYIFYYNSTSYNHCMLHTIFIYDYYYKLHFYSTNSKLENTHTNTNTNTNTNIACALRKEHK